MNAIQKYFKYRQSLIDQYAKGDLTKREYLVRNYEAVVYGDIRPFRNADTVDKALFNYQYYNALAKEMQAKSNQNTLEYELKCEYQEKSRYYYRKKDQATLRALQLLDYHGVEAYFVKVKSKALKNRLIEILLPEQSIILHSASPYVLEKLKEELVFIEESRRSPIDDYINRRY